MNLQDSFHPGKGLAGLCSSGSHCFGTVHTGTAAEADDGFAVVFVIKLQRLSHIFGGRICHCFVIKDIRNAAVYQRLFQTAGKAKLMDSGVCDDQYAFTFFLL